MKNVNPEWGEISKLITAYVNGWKDGDFNAIASLTLFDDESEIESLRFLLDYLGIKPGENNETPLVFRSMKKAAYPYPQGAYVFVAYLNYANGNFYEQCSLMAVKSNGKWYMQKAYSDHSQPNY